MPEISVIMATFNAEKYIYNAIKSILNQNFINFELIIVDDGSTDNTVSVIEKFFDKRIILIKNKLNYGVSISRNSAIHHSNSPFIAVMDSDDISYPNRLFEQILFMSTNKDCVAVGSWVTLLTPNGINLYNDDSPPTDQDTIINALEKNGGGIFPNTAMMRTDAVRRIGGYRSHFESSEDLDLLLRLSEHGTIANIGDFLYGYRLNPNGLTFTGKEKRDFFAQQALKLWKERKKTGSDSLDTEGEKFPIYDNDHTKCKSNGYNVNSVISYFYWKSANDCIKKKNYCKAINFFIKSIIYDPTYIIKLKKLAKLLSTNQ